jgi:ribosomal protein L37E
MTSVENIENSCVHCSKNIHENFCSNCGQKRYKRIDRKYIWDEIQYTTIHVNKGFFYSIKNIMKNPGKTARAYIAGDRVSHYKPISLAFILASISAVISINVVELYKMMGEVMYNNKMSSSFGDEIMPFVNKYNSYMMLLFVPIMAIFTRFIFRKWGNNFYEHVVINAIGISHYLVITILVMYPIVYFLKSDPALCVKITYFSFLLIPIYMAIFFKGFYPEYSWKTIILKVLWLTFLILLAYMLCIILFAVGIFIFKGAAGAIDYTKAKH